MGIVEGQGNLAGTYGITRMNQARQELSLIGRRALPLEVGSCADLTEADLASLSEERSVQKAIPIKHLAQRHHRLARYIASGVPHGEAAILCDYTLSRVSILMSDPAFSDLVTHYAKQVDEKFLTMNEKMAFLGEDMVDTLARRHANDPDSIDFDQLLKAVTVLADRTGNGPSQKTEVNVKIGLAERMASAAKRVAAKLDVVDAVIVSEGNESLG